MYKIYRVQQHKRHTRYQTIGSTLIIHCFLRWKQDQRLCIYGIELQTADQESWSRTDPKIQNKKLWFINNVENQWLRVPKLNFILGTSKIMKLVFD